jgi:hypothetical protein
VRRGERVRPLAHGFAGAHHEVVADAVLAALVGREVQAQSAVFGDEVRQLGERLGAAVEVRGAALNGFGAEAACAHPPVAGRDVLAHLDRLPHARADARAGLLLGRVEVRDRAAHREEGVRDLARLRFRERDRRDTAVRAVEMAGHRVAHVRDELRELVDVAPGRPVGRLGREPRRGALVWHPLRLAAPPPARGRLLGLELGHAVAEGLERAGDRLDGADVPVALGFGQLAPGHKVR